MDTYFFYPDLEIGSQITLPPEEAKHLKTLRVKSGDDLQIVNGKGLLAKGRVISPQVKNSLIEITQILEKEQPRDYRIHIAIAPTKNADRIEWFLEKAIEIGIDEVSFIKTKRCERIQLKSERLFKKSVAAIKQSLRLSIPKINPPKEFEDFLGEYASDSDLQKFIAYTPTQKSDVLEKYIQTKSSYLVLIGSEGGFTPEEAQEAQDKNFTAVSLGDFRLRAETAALYACTVLNSRNRTF